MESHFINDGSCNFNPLKWGSGVVWKCSREKVVESAQGSILISLFVSLKFCLIKFSFPLFFMNILLNFLLRLCKANILHDLINQLVNETKSPLDSI